ncbi:glycosyltransferase family 2 protein [Deinococcus maricopensis]|uniref:Glycosyl transferase family 2 n=1 Tax=Deinococcus maricopensis (strain DSM 21211 / LMG 22137 / NRRL B-23946 / LB-34) TaxID=709986 RepID=E8U371_DEIML|nr:glycosyltransferase family 2 protein [Deinococcus maricopensis]ADV66016.1 glycosyl transferase family 2 [Deinococcus maricopensis DSM 21211]
MVWIALIAVLFLVRMLLTAALACCHARTAPRALPRNGAVSVLIAAYNEEVGIERTIESVLAQRIKRLQVIVVDDGSSDNTAAIVARIAHRDRRVKLIQQSNAGKAAALNTAMPHIQYPVAVSVDADSVLAPGALAALAAHFKDPRVGAVSGDVRVAGRRSWLTTFQALEYLVGQHLDKRAQQLLGAITVVPGAAGAFRTALLRDVGGYSTDTVTEDMDLTIQIAARGYRVHFEPRACSYTEPPADLHDLWRQRLRWMFGTWQVLGKHRHLMFRRRAGTLGLLGLPYVLLFGIGGGLLAPLLDFTLVAFILSAGAALSWLEPLLTTLGAELAATSLAVLLGRDRWQNLALVWPQRLFIRAFGAMVIAVTLYRYLRGSVVHWDKLKRHGVQLEGSRA